MRTRLTWLLATVPLLGSSGACSAGLQVGEDKGDGGSAGDSGNDDEEGSGGRAASGGKAASSGGRRGDGGSGGRSGGGGASSGGNGVGGEVGSGGAEASCDVDCPNHASCLIEDREAVCVCDDGFEDDEGQCVDIDECGEDNECSPHADCENTDGGYDCACKGGYLGDGETCVPRTRLLSAKGPNLGGNFPAQHSAISSNGRVIAFSTSASDLVPNDNNGLDDVFVFDLETSRLQRANLGPSGVEGDSFSSAPSLSGDGRFVAFSSYATNLVPGDTNGAMDVFRTDLSSGSIECVSVSSSGNLASGAQSFSAFPTISDDGSRVSFASLASNLVSGDTNDYVDNFVRDVAAGTTTRVTVTTPGAQIDSPGTLPNTSPQIAGAGRYVVFASISPQLGGSNDTYIDVFRRDLRDNVTALVSYGNQGLPNNGSSENPSPSADGRFVVFSSESSTMVAGDTNGVADIFIRDMQLGLIERVSLSDDEVQPNERSFLGFQRSVSNDGRYVVFSSMATNLVPDDTNGYTDVFIRDRVNLTTKRVSVGPNGEESDGPSNGGTISADGHMVAFESASTTFGADPNGYLQVWVRDLSP